jgi:CRP-like cAMP-binding protein
MADKLESVLKMFANFDRQELKESGACFKRRSVLKNAMLLSGGDVCKEFYFIISGGIRIFFLDRNGREKTRYVMVENHIGTALTSFVSQKPSIEFIQAFDDTELLAVRHADFYKLNKEINHWKSFYQRILEMAYSFQTKRIESLVTQTAKRRYELVLKENPALIQRLSNKVLASYLDIREETLSRLKSA